ncbi:MFS transporter [Sinosporangium siamense]|uniref:MFS transporter n=1 Tax=Sinosporangium siamense TaxID=1367973 RepID=A0A919RHF4_9ACTN|nr:glycoside-pentoside-hexuronide (GPH):cation symporter [Sinosporangium siamense]GII92459.1 MFS transporter [Sinosporangium siamense]
MTSTLPPVRRTPAVPGIGEKFAYFGGVLGASVMGGVTGFLMLYLTEAVGVGAAAVGTLLLVARIVDGVGDPVMGYIVDHLPTTKRGRFRSYVLVGAVLCALCAVAMFVAPAWFPSALAGAWIAYLLWGVVFDFMQIPLASLVPSITDDPKSRGHLAGIGGFTTLIGAAIVTGVTLPMVGAFGGGTRGWLMYATVFCLAGLALVVIMVLGVRERVVPVSPERYRLADVRRVFFSGRAVPILLLAKVCVQVASGSLTAALPYFFLYYVGDQKYMSMVALVMAVPMVIGAVVVPALARRIGSKPSYMVSLGVAIAGLALIYVMPANPALVLSCFGVAGFGLGGSVALNLLLLAELTDYTEWKHGYRTEGSLNAMTSFATKAGGGVGGGLVAYVMALTGFQSGGVAQNEGAIHGILLAQSVVPAVIGILGVLAFAAYPITRAVAARATAELAERRTATA